MMDHPIHLCGIQSGAQVVSGLATNATIKAFKGYENTFTKLGVKHNPNCLEHSLRVSTRTIRWMDTARRWEVTEAHLSAAVVAVLEKKIGIWGLVCCLMGKSGPFASGDWILPDLTIQGSFRLNSHIQTFPDTYYFSYATKRTRKIMGITIPSGLLGIHPLLFIRVLQMSQWRYPSDATPLL
ncbi:hypothetical protein Sango_1076200 [Sesamum angolense]|uniref:Uncharacterized protein n=1 Tax=Sesamum angolense TaxID=2727404 RepID=A0AAE1WUJ1_9LAMI|nr:hypothetical protein Sango_1076200 [Sesamum angolense]